MSGLSHQSPHPEVAHPAGRTATSTPTEYSAQRSRGHRGSALLGGREWFTERDAPATHVSGDILAPRDERRLPPSECTTVPVIPRERSEARNT